MALGMSFTAISRPVCRGCLKATLRAIRGITTQPPAFPTKYADRLQRKSEESGISVRELLKKAEIAKEKQRKSDIEALKKANEKLRKQSGCVVADLTAPKREDKESPARKDAPPYKDLSSILNLQRLFSTPHTAEQISALWTAYHASRSGGTGRGFVCASIPLALYDKMAKNGRKYPSFVVPVRRVQHQVSSPSEQNQENVAHEFYYLQWNFYPPPPIPSAVDDPFLKPTYTTSAGLSNPSTSTILYTPLQEYKLRQAFATPYLVLTMYTDLAASHGIVLLRGEITPSTSSESYMMTQEDAQLLTLALQRFYLWSEEGGIAGTELGKGGRNLLVTFHEKPQDFNWKDLLKFADPSTV